MKQPGSTWTWQGMANSIDQIKKETTIIRSWEEQERGVLCGWEKPCLGPYLIGRVGGWLLGEKQQVKGSPFSSVSSSKGMLSRHNRKGSPSTLLVLRGWGHPGSYSQNSLWFLFCSLYNLITHRIKNQMPDF